MHTEIKKQCYELMISKPTWTNEVIAKHLNTSHGTVDRARQTLIGKIDYELAKKVTGKFLVEFQMASDYFKLQIERLDFLKTKKNKIVLKDGTVIEVELSPLEYAVIEKQQTELWKNIIEYAGQGQVLEVMRLISNGKIQPAIS